MIKNILVAQDGSRHAGSALECAIWLAARFDATITGLHVVDVVALEGPMLHDLSGSLGFEPFLNFSSKMKEVLEANGKAVLKNFEQVCDAKGVKHTSVLSSGIVSSEICEKARLSDLVVMGRRGTNVRFEYGLMGSVAEGVVRKSPCPVFVQPESFKAPAHPLLAYDGSRNASRAMHSAAEFVKGLDLPLTVVTAVKDGEEGAALLKDAGEYLGSHGVKVELACITDEPPESIAEYSKQHGHDLIFMGATRHSRIVAMVLGSATEYVMRAVEVPFFLER